MNWVGECPVQCTLSLWTPIHHHHNLLPGTRRRRITARLPTLLQPRITTLLCRLLRRSLAWPYQRRPGSDTVEAQACQPGGAIATHICLARSWPPDLGISTVCVDEEGFLCINMSFALMEWVMHELLMATSLYVYFFFLCRCVWGRWGLPSNWTCLPWKLAGPKLAGQRPWKYHQSRLLFKRWCRGYEPLYYQDVSGD